MVDIYTLEECPYCKEAKALMEKEGILYKEFRDTEYPSIFDKLEEGLKTSYYPIVKVNSGTKPVFLISDLSEYPRTLYPQTYYFQTINHLIQLIKSHI